MSHKPLGDRMAGRRSLARTLSDKVSVTLATPGKPTLRSGQCCQAGYAEGYQGHWRGWWKRQTQ